MKTIIVFVDHSRQSEHAARYAVNLAKKINANIVLSDAIRARSAELALHGAGPYDDLEDSEPAESSRLLNFCTLLENELEQKTLPGKFSPAIYCQSAGMPLGDAIDHFEETLDVAFIVLGINLYYGTSSIIAGGACGKLLAHSKCPVILVPEDAPIRYPEKYAFVADINNQNVSTLMKVAEIAAYSAAELMLVNINNGRPLDEDQEGALRLIIRETINQVDYGRIYYRHLPNEVLKSDVEWLMQDNKFEMLAVVYHKHNIISPLLEFNYDSKMLGNINFPLLIYPGID